MNSASPSILFAFNEGYTSATDHKGDLAGVQVVYDRITDKIVRAAYSQHGHSIILFDLARTNTPELVSLGGKRPDGSAYSVAAQKIEPLDHGYAADGAGGLGVFRGGDSHLFMAVDPANGRFEHLAVYIEFGSHEPWPNSSGYFIGVANHDGDGVQFLPTRVKLLGANDDPFVYFGGNFGDPAGLTRHRMWYGFLESRDPADRNPYAELNGLTWPPAVDPAAGCTWTPSTSEENAPAVCPAGAGVVTGMRCNGRYCDNVSLECCPSAQGNHAAATNTTFFSEEDQSSRVCPAGQVVVGLACKGSYCDSISLKCALATKVLGKCKWTNNWFSEEGSGLGQCAANEAVAGVQCRGSNCDNKQLLCCPLGASTLQRGLDRVHVPVSPPIRKRISQRVH